VAAAEARYLGSEACRECHEVEFTLWRGSDHDRAMLVADSTTVLGNFRDTSFTFRGVTSRFYRRDGEFLVETDGPDGKLHEYRIAYTFGVDPLQQYLIPFPDGRYQVLGVAWDTRPAEAGGQRWFHLYPDETVLAGDELHWTGPGQNWNHMCAECHSTDLRKNFDSASGRFDTTWEEINVGCEACHGPGSAHVAWARTRPKPAPGAATERLSDAVMRLTASTGDRDGAVWLPDSTTGFMRREPPRTDEHLVEMCARCHARRGGLAPRYRFGRPLADTHLPSLLTEDLYQPDGQILDEVYVWGSFRQSRMYGAGVICTDCHDPHRAVVKAAGNGVCAACHEPDRFDTPEHTHHDPGGPGTACVSCHMPARYYMVVDLRHDHGFRIPRPDLTQSVGVPNPCNDCHTDKDAGWSDEAMTRWYGTDWKERPQFAETFQAAREGHPEAGEGLLAMVRDRSWPAIVRATAFRLLGAYPSPAAFAAVAEQGLTDPDPLVRMGAMDVLDAADAETRIHLAEPALDDSVLSVRAAAFTSLMPIPPGAMPPRLRRDFARVREEYEATQLANADRGDALHNLGLLYADQGDTASAERYYRLAVQRDPNFAPAYANLADLYRARDRDDMGEAVLRDGIAHLHDPAPLHYPLGLLLVRVGRRDEALRELQAAAEGAPGRADYGYAYGIALHDGGREEEALSVLTGVHERSPYDQNTVAALAFYHFQAGNRERALGYARDLVRLAPDDPGARRLLEVIESGGQP